jgi:hypothetical protein
VVASIISKSMYGVTVAAKQLGFLAGLTGFGVCCFMGALRLFDQHLVGSH